MYARHHESVVVVPASKDRVFAFVDDHSRLSSHMAKRSWMMGGGKMSIQTDAGHGKHVGSRLRLAGRVFGLELSVEEVVTEYVPPGRKTWETVGAPRLLIIGSYQMGVTIDPKPAGSLLRVFIDYSLPETGIGHWLGVILGPWYARWCTATMAHDTSRYFEQERSGA